LRLPARKPHHLPHRRILQDEAPPIRLRRGMCACDGFRGQCKREQEADKPPSSSLRATPGPTRSSPAASTGSPATAALSSPLPSASPTSPATALA
jgi:hypothetical protein